jgi:hypothetical protein
MEKVEAIEQVHNTKQLRRVSNWWGYEHKNIYIYFCYFQPLHLQKSWILLIVAYNS